MVSTSTPTHRHHHHTGQDTPTSRSKGRSKRGTLAESLHETLSDQSRRRSYMDREAGLYYNISLFGRDLHLQLRRNSRLVAPTATVEWWEESEDRHSQPIGDTDCFYTGQVSNMEDTSVAISNCDGMVGNIFCITSPSLLSPLSLPLYQDTFMSSLVLSLCPFSSPSQKLLFKTSSLPLHISSLPFLFYHLLPITLFELLRHLHLLNINSFCCSDTGLNTRHAKNKTTLP